MATQPMMQQYPQQTGFQVPQQTANMGFPQQQQPFPMQNGQSTNPFQMQQQPQAPQMHAPQIQQQFTGAGFGGYSPQPFGVQNTMPSIPQGGMPDYSTLGFHHNRNPPLTLRLTQCHPSKNHHLLRCSNSNPCSRYNQRLQARTHLHGSLLHKVPHLHRVV